MLIKKKVEVEVEVTAVRCELPVRYGDEDIPNDFPFRKGDTWTVTIDIETGIIRDWPKHFPHKVDMKVVDEGCYYLLDAEGNTVASIEQDYVPSCLPQRYGDYIEFDIDDSGRIDGWDKDADFQGSFFKEE